MQPITDFSINFSPQQLQWLNLLLAFIMFSVAIDLKPAHFKAITAQPKGVVAGLVAQLLVLPAITVALVYLIGPQPPIAMGMLLLAACPGGNMSNFLVHWAGANTALSITLTLVVTLLSAFTTPILFAATSSLVHTAGAAGSNIQLSVLNMAWVIVQLIVVPLALGMALNNYAPVLVSRFRKVARVLALLIFSGFVLGALAGNWAIFMQYIGLVFVIVLLHNGLALAAGYGTGRLARLPRADAQAVAIETGIQNSALGLVVVFNFFGQQGAMALVVAWWGIWHLISGFVLATLWRIKKG